MKKPLGIRIHKEGRKMLAYFFLILLLINTACYFWMGAYFVTTIAISAVLMIFLRNIIRQYTAVILAGQKGYNRAVRRVLNHIVKRVCVIGNTEGEQRNFTAHRFNQSNIHFRQLIRTIVVYLLGISGIFLYDSPSFLHPRHYHRELRPPDPPT